MKQQITSTSSYKLILSFLQQWVHFFFRPLRIFLPKPQTAGTGNISLEKHPAIPFTWNKYALLFLAGLLSPLGFSPFHLPGFTLVGIAFFFSNLLHCNKKQSFFLGLSFGLGYFGLGVSWVVISIHDYGQLPYPLASVITLIFITYLALFPGLLGYLYALLKPFKSKTLAICVFSSLWCLTEYLRSYAFTGFPWLSIGTTQMDTPLKYLAPLVGLPGLSFLTAFAAALLVMAITQARPKRSYYALTLVLLFLTPTLLKNIPWTTVQPTPLTVGAVQANLSMRDKWDDALFWQLLDYYKNSIQQLLNNQLIILPESAIPLPADYLHDYLSGLNKSVLQAKSALLLGILQPTDNTETHYYNALISLGHAKGKYIKQHLVPFGEYIPKPFLTINQWLGLPEPALVIPHKNQPLVRVFKHPIASLICYEIAYPHLLRQQLPQAQWIISISDNGWFGHSLASYQQLQMAQMLSLITGRFQVLVNNDGLSSIINAQGEIEQSLPPFSAGLLQGEIFPAYGTTPWVFLQDYPVLIFCLISLSIAGRSKRRYP